MRYNWIPSEIVRYNWIPNDECAAHVMWKSATGTARENVSALLHDQQALVGDTAARRKLQLISPTPPHESQRLAVSSRKREITAPFAREQRRAICSQKCFRILNFDSKLKSAIEAPSNRSNPHLHNHPLTHHNLHTSEPLLIRAATVDLQASCTISLNAHLS